MTQQLQAPLFPPGEYPSFRNYLQETWRRRDFAVSLGKTQVVSKNASFRLGMVWLLLEPLMMTGVYAIVFGFGLRGGRDVPDINFVSWLILGQVLYNWSSTSINAKANTIRANRSLIATFTFPRLVLIFANEYAAYIRLAFGMASAFALAACFGDFPHLTTLWMIPALAAQSMLNVGLGSIAARAANRLPDVVPALLQLFRLLFFASMIFFPVSRFEDQDHVVIRLFIDTLPLNPFYCFVHIARWAVLGYESPDFGLILLSAGLWSFLGCTVGIWFFFKGETLYNAVRAR